jgi:hypothetical protein
MSFIGVLAPFAKFRKATISFVIYYSTRVFMKQPVYRRMDFREILYWRITTKISEANYLLAKYGKKITAALHESPRKFGLR